MLPILLALIALQRSRMIKGLTSGAVRMRHNPLTADTVPRRRRRRDRWPLGWRMVVCEVRFRPNRLLVQSSRPIQRGGTGADRSLQTDSTLSVGLDSILARDYDEWRLISPRCIARRPMVVPFRPQRCSHSP